MQGNKKLNLLPIEIKNKYINKYLICVLSVICGIFILALLVQYINIGVLNHGIHKIQQENERYNEEKGKMDDLQARITAHKEFLESYQNGNFPFSKFMRDLEQYRPYSVSIISVDSKDRLINEGVKEEKTEEKTETAKENTETDKKSEADMADKEPQEEKDKPTEEEQKGKIEYLKDLASEEISIRGYGSNAEDISSFIYGITKLDYVKSAKITAIEQRELEDNMVNIFEILVVGGEKN